MLLLDCMLFLYLVPSRFLSSITCQGQRGKPIPDGLPAFSVVSVIYLRLSRDWLCKISGHRHPQVARNAHLGRCVTQNTLGHTPSSSSPDASPIAQHGAEEERLTFFPLLGLTRRCRSQGTPRRERRFSASVRNSEVSLLQNST